MELPAFWKAAKWRSLAAPAAGGKLPPPQSCATAWEVVSPADGLGRDCIELVHVAELTFNKKFGGAARQNALRQYPKATEPVETTGSVAPTSVPTPFILTVHISRSCQYA
jgi:hypothetical protein